MDRFFQGFLFKVFAFSIRFLAPSTYSQFLNPAGHDEDCPGKWLFVNPILDTMPMKKIIIPVVGLPPL